VMGTGSVGEALLPDGTRVEVGGWGFPVADEGSGAWLGLAAMRIAQRALDGRAPAGALARAVWVHAGATRASLLAWCAQAGQAAYAQLAPLVFQTEAQDPQSARLLARLLEHVQSHIAALDPKGSLPVVLHGSIGQRVEPLLAPALRARCVPAAGDALDGALALIRTALAQGAQ